MSQQTPEEIIIARGLVVKWITHGPDRTTPSVQAQYDLEQRIAQAISAEREKLAAVPKWTCFHCGFETSDHKEAAGHFGDRDEEFPLCVPWAELDKDGKARECQDALGKAAEEFEENCKLRSTIEGLEYRLLEFENLLGIRFKNCRSINDAYNLYDSMEGRALAAEERLATVERERDALKAELEKLKGRRFPIQCAGTVPYAEAQRAYKTYASLFGTGQSLDRLGQRGGFGDQEFLCLWHGHDPGRCKQEHAWINFDSERDLAEKRLRECLKELETYGRVVSSAILSEPWAIAILKEGKGRR